MNRLVKTLAAVAPLALAAGCGDAAKLPAEAALKAADAAIATLDAEAQKYAPDQVAAVRSAYQGARDLASKQDYKGALAALEPVPGKVKEALAAAAARKDELVKAWTTATAELPPLVEAIRGRLAGLSELKKLPKGLEAASVTAAKDGLASLEAALAKATADFRQGELQAAVDAAKGLVPRAQELARSLEVEAPRKP